MQAVPPPPLLRPPPVMSALMVSPLSRCACTSRSATSGNMPACGGGAQRGAAYAFRDVEGTAPASTQRPTHAALLPFAVSHHCSRCGLGRGVQQPCHAALLPPAASLHCSRHGLGREFHHP